MAVPKKRVSRTRKNLRHTNWKREIIPQALHALSIGKRKLGQTSSQSQETVADVNVPTDEK
jgi:ribosomal protein L32